MIFKKPNSKNWYYKFTFHGVPIKESTKQSNKRVAERMEAAHRTRLAMAQVGIFERPRTPTVEEFADRFLDHIRSENADKPATVKFYECRTKALLNNKLLAKLPLDSITSEHTRAFAQRLRVLGYETSTINRNLATLRRMTYLLADWEGTLCRKIKMLKGENQREYVLTADDEAAYLAAADPLLRNVAVIMLDCGLRPEEAHRLTWEQYRERHLTIWKGKAEGSRRRIEVTTRVALLLEALPRTSPFVFPAETKSGHIDASSYKKQHEKAVKDSGLLRFVPYSLRHTAITNLAMTGLDAPALMYWAGHRSLSTTMRYIHLAADFVNKRVRELRAGGGPSFGPTLIKSA